MRACSTRRRELKVLERDTAKLETVHEPYPRITYDDAVTMLKDKGFAVNWGDDFGADEETALSVDFYGRCGPSATRGFKPFYMKHDPDRPDLALACDMLAPEGYGEIIGGGQREDDYDSRSASSSTACRWKRSTGTSIYGAWVGAARRLRDGHRARGRGSAGSITCAKRCRFRA